MHRRLKIHNYSHYKYFTSELKSKDITRSLCYCERGQDGLLEVDLVTFCEQKVKQLPAQRSVGHGLPDEAFLFSQLLWSKVLRLSGHSLVVVQQSQ